VPRPGPARDLSATRVADHATPSSDPRSVPEDYARGAWSVTVEIHDARDPARSRRVLCIPRLHLGAYGEACEVVAGPRTAQGKQEPSHDRSSETV
jgi:hypothetical protein